MSRHGFFTAALVGLIASAASAASSGPQPGDVKVTFTVGQSSRYCGECGGTPAGNPDGIYKRLDCTAPASCF